MRPTTIEVNRMVRDYDARDAEMRRRRGFGLDGIVAAPGGQWLARMQRLEGAEPASVMVGGYRRAAVRYRGLLFAVL